MNEREALSRMVAPGQIRPGKYRNGVIQILVTRACDKSCYSCTQGSNFAGKPATMTREHFEQALLSLKGYFGVVGVFGGNPAMHPDFAYLCEMMDRYVPFEQRGLWCNNPLTAENAKIMRKTFNPAVSNLNVHLDHKAFDLFKTHWPESRPFGLTQDSRHCPPFVSMIDLGIPEEERWELISHCDINQHWSALIGVFRGELRAWFCEIAGAQAMLHQHEPDYPDTGIDPVGRWLMLADAAGVPFLTKQDSGNLLWWQLPMWAFKQQVRQHCHHCSIPLRGYGQLAQGPEDQAEQVSTIHASVGRPKHRRRPLQIVTERSQIASNGVQRATDYLGNAKV